MAASAGSKVASVVVNYRTAALAVRCVTALVAERAALPGWRVVVVDGGSADGSADRLREALRQAAYRDWVELLPLDINGGFGWANNQAMLRLMQGSDPPDFIHLLNPDTEIEPGAVTRLKDFLLARPEVGAVGSQLLEPDGSPTGSAFTFPSISGELARGARTAAISRLLGVRETALKPREQPCEVDWATGASVMFRVAALKDSGLFDDGFFLYHEEVELMWRLRRAGWSVWHEPASRVKHIGGAATGVHSRPSIGAPRPRRPAYWYRSRRRFFALTRGRVTALSAGLGWVVGHLLWRVRAALGLARKDGRVDRELGDQIRYSIVPRGDDCRHAAPAIDTPPGELPAWSRWGL